MSRSKSKKTASKSVETEPAKVKAVNKQKSQSPFLAKSGVSVEAKTDVKNVEIDAKKYKKTLKNVKAKIIRDSFSFPEQDYLVLTELKKAFAADGLPVKRGEILRAGLHLLTKLNVVELQQVIGQVERV